MKAGILTLSDKGARGEREDLSGAALRNWLEQRDVKTHAYEMIPDEETLISAKLIEWADTGDLDIILTTG
ncbi:MAG TPA: molybdopterin-binding protein, partial [Geobacteraceae bacterium]|nr:molybdopterin-binding protein [Geobacteraceae bacterium]